MSDSPAVRALCIGENEYDFHRFETAGPLFERFLENSGRVDLTLSTDRSDLTTDTLQEYDVLIDYLTDPPMDDQQEAVLEFVRAGNGYVPVHCAADVSSFVPEPQVAVEELIGGAFLDHPEQCDLDVEIVDQTHQITRGIEDFTVWDEPYEIRWTEDDVHVLARMNHEELGDLPVAWTKSYGHGRVFYCSLGHDEPALSDATVQLLITRGTLWAADQA